MAGVSSGENCTAWFSHKCQGRPITCTGSYGGNVTAGSNSYRRSNWRAVRWIVSIEDYDFEMEFRAGRQNGNADGITNPRPWSPRLKELRTTTAIRTIYFCMAFKKKKKETRVWGCNWRRIWSRVVRQCLQLPHEVAISTTLFFWEGATSVAKDCTMPACTRRGINCLQGQWERRDAEIRSKVWI